MVDQDGGEAAKFLLREITTDSSLSVLTYSASDAQSQLDDNTVVAVLTIPAGFSVGVQQSTPVNLVITTGKNADPQIVEAIRLVVEGIAADMTLESQILASLQQMGEMQATAPEEYQVFSTERVLEQARGQFKTAQARPLINVVQCVPQQDPNEEETPDLSLSRLLCPLDTHLMEKRWTDHHKKAAGGLWRMSFTGKNGKYWYLFYW